MKVQDLLKKIEECVIQGRRDKEDAGFNETDGGGVLFTGQPAIKELLAEALKNGINPNILIKTLDNGMKIVGQKFKAKEYFIPDMLASAQTSDMALILMAPYLKKNAGKKKIKIILATVKGDFHDIGKRIVGYIFKGAGFNVIDLGVDVSEKELINTIRREKPQILGLSALLTTTMSEMKVVIEKLKTEGLRDNMKVIVGGAPLSQDFAEEIDADGYASDAFSGVALVQNLCKKKKRQSCDIFPSK